MEEIYYGSKTFKSIRQRKKKKVDYDDIDWHFRKDFLNWLYAEPRNHAINNASKIFEVIKQFIQESYKLRYHENKIFDKRGFDTKNQSMGLYFMPARTKENP